MKEHHSLTELIPERADQSALVMDIAHNGVHEPVYLYETKVIEGRVRYRASLEVGLQPQFRDWVLLDVKGAPLDWMVRRHIEQHNPAELDRIRLVAALLPAYRELPGQTHGLLNKATGLAWNKVRLVDWLQEAGKLDVVLSGEMELFDAGRRFGLVADKKKVALADSYGKGDKFDEATVPMKRYLAAWKRKDYEFRHLNPKEASRRLLVIDQLVEELVVARVDIEKRSHAATLSAPPERKERR